MKFFCKKRTPLNQRGVTILSVALSSAIIFLSYWAYSTFESNTMTNQRIFREKYIAKLYAVELTEFFRGFESSNSLLKDYMKANIPLCSKINQLDRTNGNITSQDTTANLDANYLDSNLTHGKANRYYQVDIVDATTLEPNNSYCASSAQSINLKANERALVTVTLNWIPQGKALENATSVELTAIIPGQ